MIRRWLGKCEQRDRFYGAVYCKLQYKHDGDCHFGTLHTAYLTMDLDAPIHFVDSPPTEPAMPVPPPFASPPPGPGGVATRHCCCHCRCKEAP